MTISVLDLMVLTSREEGKRRHIIKKPCLPLQTNSFAVIST